MYIYPDNLKAKAKLWLWELRDVAVIGTGLLLSVLALSHGSGMLLLVLGLALIGGGAGWYFKVYRPKQEKAAGPVEGYDEELEDYDDPGDDLPPWDEEDEYTEDDE